MVNALVSLDRILSPTNQLPGAPELRGPWKDHASHPAARSGNQSVRIVADLFDAVTDACDKGDVATASELLATAEAMIHRRNAMTPRARQRCVEQLVDAHFRVLELRLLPV